MKHAEIDRLLGNPLVREIVDASRAHTVQSEHTLQMPWENGVAYVHTEGHYPLHSDQGRFDAFLLRSFPVKDNPTDFRGGEFRVLTNAQVKRRLYDHDVEPLLVTDTIPLFLKELADSRVQHELANARQEVASYPGPAFLIQKKASDVHDGEKRLSRDGQQDMNEERWYGKILMVMKLYPGIDDVCAGRILLSLGEKPFYQDYGLGVATTLAYFYPGKEPARYQQMFLDGTHLLRPFDGPPVELNQEGMPNIDEAYIRRYISANTASNERLIEVEGQHIHVRNIVSYPLRQNGVELSVQLVAAQRKGQRGFQTFRIARYGNQDEAYFRADSICTNGVQGGDNHCDCLEQTRNELKRADEGTAMCIINMRDDEGRAHGEANKGATLEVQRRMEHELGIAMGNGSAAQLFYAEPKLPVDARRYDTLSAVIEYLEIKRIAHLVTDNSAKVTAIGAVAEIGEIVTAEVIRERMSAEAQLTKQDKQAGKLGVVYTYRDA